MIIGNVVFPSLSRRDNGGITNKTRYHSDTTPKEDRRKTEGTPKEDRRNSEALSSPCDGEVRTKKNQKSDIFPLKNALSQKKCIFFAFFSSH